MSTQTALWLPKEFGQYKLGTRDTEKPGPDEVLIKVMAAALNPLDWKVQDHGNRMIKDYPAILGFEGSGIVEDVGESVTEHVKGDKVFFSGFMTNRHATFQHYTIMLAAHAAKIPDNISLDQAASIPAGLTTAVDALYSPKPHGLAFTPPWEEGGRGKYTGKSIVVLGGASAVGQFVIQVARLSGFSPIIATASLHNTTLLTSLGATHVVDRHLPLSSLAQEVAKVTSTPTTLVFDAVATSETQQAGYDLLVSGGQIAVVLPPTIQTKPEDNKQILLMFGSFFPPEKREFGTRMYSQLTRMFAEAELVPLPVEVLPDGLNGIVPGLERLKNNLISGKKLIAHPWDTA
ncbi:hypothetical protein SERLA73DRAFT_180782 [Serpula lacrymans var. lacrymans S7.3]|uniref:Enoyl reductase (ER) domain-containing protein n=2 Tax=Serpula lacrymans var. lacrymans TaxID=341189 RepID=F8PWF9_SERL3|nr:uncharacterized protein SERLADRAFT_466535 [Serpula lacrymans var. lacrymans S7.9]EGO00283.1 hypothetical protein SERLA73DRAFT_180782 [Serpula lacrymans var. lacrymans S7.3]EGO25842.1 hypothetical protein SERLADRAFT_466535 [Serpula lacrymans var. lacrymans S7.9]